MADRLGFVPDHLQDAAMAALREGRLHWRCTDAQGRPSNGGTADPIPPGEWSPPVEDAVICSSGWHMTTDPLSWRGVRVWLVEGDGLAGVEGDKTCWKRIRPLAEVDPMAWPAHRACIAARRADLSGADLSGADLTRADLYGANLYGADLSEANLYGADLSRANLFRAYLSRADLSRANLYGANLSRANLYGANLYGADLYGADLARANLVEADLSEANLYGADLSRADLYGANLSRANLYGADLSGASLSGASLSGANLAGANLAGADLGDWERGPDGYARRAEVPRG